MYEYTSYIYVSLCARLDNIILFYNTRAVRAVPSPGPRCISKYYSYFGNEKWTFKTNDDGGGGVIVAVVVRSDPYAHAHVLINVYKIYYTI